MAKNNVLQLSYERAQSADLLEIQRLLESYKLPAEDIGEHIRHFVVARLEGRLVGVVGLEHSGASAVLRSLAVDGELRGSGIGKELYRRIVEYARGLGIKELGLLTTTAEGFFTNIGFDKCDNKTVPEYIRATKEYKYYCPSTAVVMTKRISEE